MVLVTGETVVEQVIRVRGLRKAFGRVVALDRVDLDIARGEVFALVGPNGAGKTSAVEILEGLLARDAGEVIVLGADPARPPRRWRSASVSSCSRARSRASSPSPSRSSSLHGEEAEDLTQETFLRAFRARDSLRDVDAVLPWLYSVATHVCVDRLRQRTREARTASDLDPEAVSPPDPDPGAALRAEQKDMSGCVEAYVSELSDSYRAVLLMHDVKGLTAREISELLGDSTGNVKIRLHRARTRLRAALEAGCEFSQNESGTLVCDPKG